MRQIVRFTGILALALGALACAAMVVDEVHVWSVRRKATEVRRGDTEARVREILGNPQVDFPKAERKAEGLLASILSGPKQRSWAYGRYFDWKDSFHAEFPFFYPVRWRLFSPASDDVVIVFDDRGVVTDVTIPDDDP